jgi:hypothetical protein
MFTTLKMNSQNTQTFHRSHRDSRAALMIDGNLEAPTNLLTPLALLDDIVDCRARSVTGGSFAPWSVTTTQMTAASMLESLLAYAPFQWSGGVGQAYDEETFRHFLMLERQRARTSGRSFLLVLVSLKPHLGHTSEIPASATAALFSGLGECVREVDFVGWYREGRMIGAVLTQGTEPPADALPAITSRVNKVIARRLPRRITERLRVRVMQLRGGARC